MKKSIIIVAAVFLLSGNIFAQPQPPDTLWSNTFGGYSYEICYSVCQTVDGGYFLGGETQSYSSGPYDTNIYVIKTNEQGDLLWGISLGGTEDDRCYSVQQTADTGYILAGYTNSFSESTDFWLVKMNEDGDSLWSKTLGRNNVEVCYSVQQTSDEGYILAGYTKIAGAIDADFCLIKTNEEGDSLWSRVFGEDSSDVCKSVQQTSDGGYILVGYTCSYGAGNCDYWLLKTNEYGDSLWSRTFGGIEDDVCNSVRQTSDEGYILAGYTKSFGSGEYDFWIIKTDENGDSVWSKTLGGEGGESCHSVQQTSDEGYILAGLIYPFPTGWMDFWLVKMNGDGDSLWSQTFGGNYNDVCNSIQQTSDGGYILAGETWSFGWGYNNFWLVKTGVEMGVEGFPSFSIPKAFSLSPAYPNPFNQSTQITFSLPTGADASLIVYDINGREVALIVDEWYPAGIHQAVFDGSELSSGIYFAKFIAGEFIQTRKLVLMK